MNLSEFQIYSYAFATREGLIIRLIDAQGREGIGEVAPLLPRNSETLAETLKYARLLRNELIKRQKTTFLLPPSLMFGMEMALFSLLSPLEEDIPFDLIHLSSDGSDVKVKVKDMSVKKAITYCEDLLLQKKKIRIDVNGAWNLAQTVEFCSHFKPGDFLYIEEPVSLFSDLEPFYDQTGCSYALDEHLSRLPLETLLSLQGLSHLIVKPTAHGGLTRCKEMVELAKGKQVVFSSSYETGIGLMHIVRISHILAPSSPIGIDTPSSLIHFNPKENLLKKELYHKMEVPWNTLERVI